MKYRSDDGTEEEWLWNSRDGVTPFVISLRSGKYATHVDWHLDRRDPNHIPKPGDRIFIDLTYAKALEYAKRNRKNYPYAHRPSLRDLVRGYLRDGAPDIVEIT